MVHVVANPGCRLPEAAVVGGCERGAHSAPSELWQGSGGAAPSWGPGAEPRRGARGAEPPGKFLKNRPLRTYLRPSEI